MAKTFNPAASGGPLLDFGSILSSGAFSLLGLLPGLRNVINSPAFTNFQRAETGRGQSAELRANAPEYQVPSLTGSMFRAGGREISLPSIGNQAFREREEMFRGEQEIARGQRGATSQLRSELGNLDTQFNRLDRMFAGAQSSALAGINSGLRGLERSRRDTFRFMQTSLAASNALLQEVKGQAKTVREGFDLDVTRRIEAVSSGIDAASKANFSEHLRALESQGPVSQEERSALQAMYRMDGARQTAIAAGGFHESAVELRSQLDTSLARMVSEGAAVAAGQKVETLMGGGATLADLEKTKAGLQVTRAQTIQNFTIARGEMREYVSKLKIEGTSALFDMVSRTITPVLAFSDVMSTLFDVGWDIMAFHNNVRTQDFQNLMAIQNPQNVAIMAALGARDSNRIAEQQIEAYNRASRNNLFGSVVEATGSIVSGGLAGRGGGGGGGGGGEA